MKYFYILILLALAGFGVYKYSGEFFDKKDVIGKSEDPRIVQLRVRAEKLYPTKKNDRTSWFDAQVGALFMIDKLRDEIPSKFSQSIRTFAAKKYGEDYVKQFDFIKKQEFAFMSISSMLKTAGMSEAEREVLFDGLESDEHGNFCEREYIVLKVVEIYKMLKSRKGRISDAEYVKLMNKAVPMILSDKERAVDFIDAQILARHNFLTKTLPASMGDVRSSIEQKYPDDFVAQLDALNKLVEDSTNRATIDFGIGIKFFNITKSVITHADDNGETYLYAYVNLNGKKGFILPFSCAQNMNFDKFYLSKIDLKGTSYVMVEKNSGLALLPDVESKCVPLEVLPNSELEKNLDVVIYVYDQKNGFREIECGYNGKSGTLSIGDKLKVENININYAIVLDKKTQKLVGFIENANHSGFDLYKLNEDNTDEDFKFLINSSNRDSLGSSDSAVKGVLYPVIRNEEKNYWRFIKANDMNFYQTYAKEKNDSEMLRLKNICLLNYQLVLFMLKNNFEIVQSLPDFKNDAESYKDKFTTPHRESFSLFYGKYRSYIARILSTSGRILKNNGISNSDDFYYKNANLAQIQSDICAELISVLNNAQKATDTYSIVHTDLKGNIVASSYVVVPVKKKSSKSSDEDTMGSVKFKYKSE